MDERKRYREIEFDFEGETRLIECNQKLKESPVGFYLYDYTQRQIYALEDGWHFDIELDGNGFSYFSIFFTPTRIDLYTDYTDLVKINYAAFSSENSSLEDGCVISFDLDGVKDFFIFTSNRELTHEEADKILQENYKKAILLEFSQIRQDLPQELKQLLDKCKLVQAEDFSLEQLMDMIEDLNSMVKEIKNIIDIKMS